MGINTVQNIMFRQLRQVHDQHKTKSVEPTKPGRFGSNSTMPRPRRTRRLATVLRRAFATLNHWLASYYRLCAREVIPTAGARSAGLKTGSTQAHSSRAETSAARSPLQKNPARMAGMLRCRIRSPQPLGSCLP